MLLVGTDSELEDDRVVSQPIGRALAKKFGCPLLEVSTRDYVNVKEAFMTIALLVITKNRLRKPRPKPRGLLGFLRPRSTTSSQPPMLPLNLFLILHGVDQAAARYALVIFLCDGLLKVNDGQILCNCQASANGNPNAVVPEGIIVRAGR